MCVILLVGKSFGIAWLYLYILYLYNMQGTVYRKLTGKGNTFLI